MPLRFQRLLTIFLGLAIVSTLHFVTRTDLAGLHVWHIFFRKLYFIPIVAGAVWFGLYGAFITAFTAIAVYSMHMLLNWPSADMERMNQIGEMGSFLILAAVSGVLVTLENRYRERADRIQRQAEREKIGASVAALTETLGARDTDTRDHSKRVAGLAKGFASFLKFPAEELHDIYLAGVLHDIGKIGIRDDVLLKPDSLTDEDRHKIMKHPEIAEHILAPIGFEKVVSYIAAHHENVDGSGYPKGLSGKEIPVPGLILAIADTYDALKSGRSYKGPMSESMVQKIMTDMAGKKLDKNLLEIFWNYIDSLSAEGTSN